VARVHTFSESSRLAASRGEVWARVSTFAGVNDELGPLLRMTAPRDVQTLDAETVTIGERICRSWVFALGVIPVDYDDLVLASIDPGRGFSERSTLLSARSWHHDRTLSDLPEGGTRVLDELRFEPRVPALGGLQARMLSAVFRHRHRRLRRHFGTA